MNALITNALLVDLDPVEVQPGGLRVEGNRIVERGSDLVARPGETIIDCGGCVVMPGLVNGHTHLYSALAAGVPPPREPMPTFHEVLRYLWWRLDRALDPATIEVSALVGALDAVRCGTTTLVDHHASPNAIDGSLDGIEAGLRAVGLRGVLCYETTDRNGRPGRDAGLAENARFAARCRAATDHRFAAMAGAHASFTCADDTLDQLAAQADLDGIGVHIHVAEDPVDARTCEREQGIGLVDRLEARGLLKAGAIFAHCTHLDAEAFARLAAAGVHVAHNTRSNMNNAVGYTPLNLVKSPVLLGTDGIGGNMFAEAQTAWFKACDARVGLSPGDILAMLANNARLASRALGVRLGVLAPGAAADVVVTDYLPATPLDPANVGGHLIFAMGSQHVRHVVCDGEWVLRDRLVQRCDEARVRRAAVPQAHRLWERMAALD